MRSYYRLRHLHSRCNNFTVALGATLQWLQSRCTATLQWLRSSFYNTNACMKAGAVLCMPHDFTGTGALRFIVYRQSSLREARRRNTALIGKATLREVCRNTVSYIGHIHRYTGMIQHGTAQAHKHTGTQAHRFWARARAGASFSSALRGQQVNLSHPFLPKGLAELGPGPRENKKISSPGVWSPYTPEYKYKLKLRTPLQ
jgi:hypothetical protein